MAKLAGEVSWCDGTVVTNELPPSAQLDHRIVC